MKLVGADQLGWGNSCVLFEEGNGNIIVSDRNNHRVCVFSPDGDTFVTTFGSRGTRAGQFLRPEALALTCLQLFVMDEARVQVFE